MRYTQNHKMAAAYIIFGSLMFAFMVSLIKLIADDVNTETIVFFRNFDVAQLRNAIVRAVYDLLSYFFFSFQRIK